jgi:sec-independent protein translocase protein TatB
MFPENRLIEILIIGALALIVVGPKDLPVLMRRVGQFIGKMRAMAAEFRASFDELARQSELEDLRKEVEAMRNDPRHFTNFNPMAAADPSGAAPAAEPPPAREPPAAVAPPKPPRPRKPRAKKPAPPVQ